MRHLTAEQGCRYHDEERSCHGAEELGSVGGDRVDAAAPGQRVEPRLAHHVQVGGDVGRRVLPAIQRRCELPHSKEKKTNSHLLILGNLRMLSSTFKTWSYQQSHKLPLGSPQHLDCAISGSPLEGRKQRMVAPSGHCSWNKTNSSICLKIFIIE